MDLKRHTKGGTLPTVINAADEVAVKLFLDKKLNFRIFQRSSK